MTSTLRKVVKGLVVVAAVHAGGGNVHAQAGGTADSARSVADSAKAKGGVCTGGLLSRAICKGSVKVYNASVAAGIFENGPNSVGKIVAPAVPIFGTYKVWLVKEGKDSLAYFLRTQELLHDRLENDPFTEYLGRFHTAMQLDDLPAVIAATSPSTMGRQASGSYMLLRSSRDTTRFGIRLEVAPPALHPEVRAARVWIGDAQTSVPTVESWSRKERERGLTQPIGAGDVPTRFTMSWKHGKEQFTVRGERISDVTVPPVARR